MTLNSVYFHLTLALASTLLVSVENLQGQESLTFGEERLYVDPLVVSGGGGPGSCVPHDARQAALEMINTGIVRNIPIEVKQCGDGMWYQIVTLDMNDSQHHCPTGWREYMHNESSVRACGRPDTVSITCANVSYTTGRQYSKVCGRVIGYQVGTPHGIFPMKTIDEIYIDGVSITHGKNPRQHIWTFATGLTENATVIRRRNCPCSDVIGRQPPEYVGANYYCESANPTNVRENPGFLYVEDKLWDGLQCEGACCTNKSPPWFIAKLTNPTSDDIEVRICGDNSPDIEDFPIEILDIYIQ